MKSALASLCILACSHSEPEQVGEPDAAVPELAHAMIVQHVDYPATTGDTATLSFAPTAKGTLLVVVIGIDGSLDSHVRTLRNNTLAFAPDTALQWSNCGRTSEVWSLRDVPAGMSAVDLTFTTPVTWIATVFEVTGVSRYPFVSFQGYLNNPGNPPPAMIYDATVMARSEELIVSTISTCGTVTGLDPTSPMTPLPLTTGSAAAFFVAPGPGMYGAHWLFDGTEWFMTTLGYR